MNAELRQELGRRVRVARSLARRAGEVCERIRAGFSGEDLAHKDGREPVTVADYVSQALITATLITEFPHDGLIAEEGGNALREGEHQGLLPAVETWFARASRAERPAAEIPDLLDHRGEAGDVVWVVDPIDGTKGFLRGDQYAVAIGFLVSGRPVGGVLSCPAWPGGAAVFYAQAGTGSWCETGNGPVPIRVSDRDRSDSMRILASVESGHGDPAIVQRVRENLGIVDIVRVDSQAKYCFVASGEAEIYLRPVSRPGYREKVWDHAAGVALVTEAGGIVSDIRGCELDFSRGSKLVANRGVVATHGRFHDAVIEAIERAEAELG